MPKKLTMQDFEVKRIGYTPAWSAINKHTGETIFFDKNKYKVIWMLQLYVAGL